MNERVFYNLGQNYLRKFSHQVHFSTQQNYFQNDAFAERKPLSPCQCCSRPGIRLSFECTTTLLSGEGGEERTGTATMFRKMLPKYVIFSTVLSKIVSTLSISFTQNTRQVQPKLQSIITLNLSDLYNEISLCNISDSSAAKNSIKRQIVKRK